MLGTCLPERQSLEESAGSDSWGASSQRRSKHQQNKQQNKQQPENKHNLPNLASHEGTSRKGKPSEGKKKKKKEDWVKLFFVGGSSNFADRGIGNVR